MTTEEHTDDTPQKSEEETALEQELKEGGWIITEENPEKSSGSMSYYLVQIAKIEDESITSAGQGVTRIDALKGALVASKAK